MSTSSVSLWSLFAVVAALINQARSCADLPLPTAQSVTEFTQRKYDYLIIGGGTAGLLVASRLAEHQSLEIGVIEAGVYHHNDPNVDVPGMSFSPALRTPDYDWGFKSIPQAQAGNKTITVARGKMLGGSSGNNLMAYGRGAIAEYDAMNLFAQSEDWTWNGLLPHFRATERTAPIDPFASFSQDSSGFDQPLFRGYHGQIEASFNEMYSAEVPDYVRALNNLGVKTNMAPSDGNPNGIRNSQMTVDRARGVRSYAATEFYCNQPPRSNLHILVGAQVTRIRFDQGTNGSIPVAIGAEFSVSGLSGTFEAGAAKEVILSAGAIQTPQLLELSGIGNSKLLQGLQIPVIVDLPGVGENLQDHPFISAQFDLVDGITTFDTLRKNQTFLAEQQALYNATHGGFMSTTDSTIVYLPLQNIADSSRINQLLDIAKSETSSIDGNTILRLQFDLQQGWIASGNVSFVELILLSKGIVDPQPTKTSTSLLAGLMHPMSRGSVHINSANPLVPPTIDLGYLTRNFDIEVLLDTMKFIQKIGKQDPFASLVSAQNSPPATIDDDALREYIRNSGSSGSHYLGTASLGPIERGGVVDGSLHVHGTSNLRIIDASVLPIQLSAHTQATVYALANAAADRIISGLS